MYLQAQERGLCYHRKKEALFARACMASFGVRTHFVWSRCSNFCNNGNALRPETVTQGHLHSQCHPRRMLGKNKLDAGYRPELGLLTNHRCEKRPAISQRSQFRLKHPITTFWGTEDRYLLITWFCHPCDTVHAEVPPEDPEHFCP